MSRRVLRNGIPNRARPDPPRPLPALTRAGQQFSAFGGRTNSMLGSLAGGFRFLHGQVNLPGSTGRAGIPFFFVCFVYFVVQLIHTRPRR